MRVSVVTLFPEMFESVLAASLLGRAREAGLVAFDFVSPREFANDRHLTCDDAPYGGGPGMVMKAEPTLAAIAKAAGDPPAHRILLTPAGTLFTQRRATELSERSHIVLVCGRYEGIDDRVARLAIDEELSVGDFVLTGGEIPAMAVIDAVARHIPGVLGDPASAEDESHAAGLLEYPCFTRPSEVGGLSVPDVLTSGDHGAIASWRREQAIERTAARRPDLLARYRPPEGAPDPVAAAAARTTIILAHHPVLDRTGAVVTTSITNLDIHDLARSVATYGLGGYGVVTPITAQREKVDHMVATWADQAATDVAADQRLGALSRVFTAPSIAAALAAISERAGGRPVRAYATTADSGRFAGAPRRSFAELRSAAVLSPDPVAIILGTGWGLTENAVPAPFEVLEPIVGRTDFNHLSVRSAAAIMLDRIFGYSRHPI